MNNLAVTIAFGIIDRTAEDITGNIGGVTCSEDKASVHGTSALPTELNGTPIYCFDSYSFFF